MGLIVLDTTQIKSSLIPSIEKSKNNFDDSIDTINCAINSYSEQNDEVRSDLKKIKDEINNISKKINNIKNEVQSKVIEKERIDDKNNRAIKSLTSNINAIRLGESSKGFIANNGNVKSGININADSRYKKIDESTKSKMTHSEVTSINNSRNRKSIIETGGKVTDKKPKTLISRVGSALKKTGSIICNGAKTVWNGLKSFLNKGKDIFEKTLASIGNAVLSLSKSLLDFAESLGDFGLMVASTAGTIFTGAEDIIDGALTGNWDFKNTKDLWDGTKAAVKYEWSNKLDQKLGLRQKLDKYAYSPFKTTGIGTKILEGTGYIAGVVVLTVATAGSGTTVLAAGGGNGLVLGSAAASATGATLTVSSSALVSGGIAAAAGMGKNTSAAWNDGASTLGGLGYGVAKGLYEGAEMTIGYAVNGFKPFKGTGMASQVGNTGVHVALDAVDGASGAFMDPLFSMIYSPNEENKAQIMYYVNYDKNGNKINDKKWEDLSFNEKYEALFKLKGGWTNVGIQAASAAAISLVSEMPDIASVKRANATYKKFSADGLTDGTVESIRNLKGYSLKNFITKADQNGQLGLITSKLTTTQLINAFPLLDKVTLKNVLDNVSESKVHEIIETDTPTLDLFTKNLSTDKIKKLNNEEFNKIKKYLNVDQIKQLKNEGVNIKYSEALSADVKKELINEICNEKLEYFDWLSKKYGTYGGNQHIIENLHQYVVKNNTWLKDENDFISFVTKNYKIDGSEVLYKIKNSTKITVDDYKIVRDYLNNSVNSRNPLSFGFVEVNGILRENFEHVQSEQYVYLRRKLLDAGMDWESAVRTLDGIDSTGACTYITIVNDILYNYKGKRELFKRDFGFDMYKVVDGKEVLNDSELLLDMYLYINSNKCIGKMFTYSSDGKIHLNIDVFSSNLDTNNQAYLNTGCYGSHEKAINKYLKSKNSNLSYSSPYYRYIDDRFMKSMNAEIKPDTVKETILQRIQEGYDIEIGGYHSEIQDGIKLIDELGNVCLSGNHSMYVIGVDDNNVIVSSWSKKYYIPIEEFRNNSYDVTCSKIGGIG